MKQPVLQADISHVLIWDGECGFCGNAVTWIEQRDRNGRFRPIPFQELPTPPMTPDLRRQAESAMQVITADGRQLSAGRAVLFVLREIEWSPVLVRLAARRPFLWFVELGYRVVARNRSLFGRLLFTFNTDGTSRRDGNGVP